MQSTNQHEAARPHASQIHPGTWKHIQPEMRSEGLLRAPLRRQGCLAARPLTECFPSSGICTSCPPHTTN
eukprot:CAMPEP_0115232338 /NCGR_PEP_ID=MMETSP0270-20121206/33715_1 /TAXON_ID=71861 /ORGANISM="Scrippsiella trochoidea, Strain CCMP3099" /LENGTH=69 /DNA_ID=CAMNT_0002647029 /DNA_START=98 /DNA_END=307 /DNA_ORIENTATION=-